MRLVWQAALVCTSGEVQPSDTAAVGAAGTGAGWAAEALESKRYLQCLALPSSQLSVQAGLPWPALSSAYASVSLRGVACS